MHDMAPNDDAHASVRKLIREKVKILAPMVAIYMVSFIGLTLLADFGRGIIGTRVFGAVNLGFVLIAFNYLLSWALALIYVKFANDRLDPLAAEAASKIKTVRAAS